MQPQATRWKQIQKSNQNDSHKNSHDINDVQLLREQLYHQTITELLKCNTAQDLCRSNCEEILRRLPKEGKPQREHKSLCIGFHCETAPNDYQLAVTFGVARVCIFLGLRNACQLAFRSSAESSLELREQVLECVIVSALHV
eukprot:5488843-Amphidinium_carterae.1